MLNVLEFSGRLNPVPTAHLHKFLNILRDSTPTKKYHIINFWNYGSNTQILKFGLKFEIMYIRMLAECFE